MAFKNFFKPRWKHDDPTVRAEAIRALGDDQQSALLAVALEDAEAGNRLAAARRVQDADILRKLRDQSSDKNIRDWAKGKLLERLVLAAKSPAADAEAVARCRAALEEVGDDQKSLEDIARNAASVEIRKAAVPKLIHAGALHAVAMAEENGELALTALAKLSRENHFESLSKQAKSKAVRLAAREKLKGFSEERKPDPDSVNRAKLNLALSAAEKTAAAAAEPSPTYAWEHAKDKVDGAEIAMRELMESGMIPELDKLSRFREHVARFRALYARHTELREAREKRDKAAAENQRLKEEICLRLETARAEPGDGEELRRLREEFQSLGPASETHEEDLRKRFRTAFEKLDRERVKKNKDLEYRIQRESEQKEHSGILSALCDEAEALLASAKDRPEHCAERLHGLRKEWRKAVSASGGFDGKDDLLTRFETACAAAESSLEQARAANLARMREIVPQMEALAENAGLPATEKRCKELTAAWKTLVPPPLGPEAETLQESYHAALGRFREAQDWLRWSNLRAKQAICDRLEALLPQEDRRAMTADLKELQAEWKSIGPVSWDSSEALWDRYHQVCDQLYETCREYFAELEVERESNLKSKEELCARIEALVAAGEWDWREAMDTVKEAQGTWKTIGAVPKIQSEALWSRFRAACDVFYAKRDIQWQENLSKKQELVALAESLQDSTQWKATGAKLKEALETWKTIGPVPQYQANALWGRFHGASERFYHARRVHFENLDQERPRNLAKKEELCLQMEGLDALADDEARFESIRAAQTAWKETGPAPKEMEDALWERFRKPIDAYFATRQDRFAEEDKLRDDNAKIKEDICAEAESLADSQDWKATIEKIKSLQEQWKATGPVPRQLDQKLWRRFRAACDIFFDRLKENSSKRNEEREANLRKKEDLCFIAESLGEAKEGTPERQEGMEKIKGLQREWKNIGPVPREHNEALWDRFQRACDVFFQERRESMDNGSDDPQANLEGKLALIQQAEELSRNPGSRPLESVRELHRRWKRVGPVPRAQSDYVWERFRDACDHALDGAGGNSETRPE